MSRKLTPCPVCNYRIDSHTVAFEEKADPVEGDASICMKCSSLLVFDAGLVLRCPTDEQLLGFMAETESWMQIERARAAVRHLMPKVK